MNHPYDAALDTRGGGPRAWLVFALLAIAGGGFAYPALSVLVGATLFPAAARGSLFESDGRPLGSALVGQPFASERYLIGRPSAAGYDPRSASGSNQSAGNPGLRARAAADAAAIATREGLAPGQVPVELLSASGSGLDPHLSPPAAALQVARIARQRGLDRRQVEAIIAAHTEPAQFGILGNARVNVLAVNLALDGLQR